MNGDQQIYQETQKKLKGKWNNNSEKCTAPVLVWISSQRVIFFCFTVPVHKLLQKS